MEDSERLAALKALKLETEVGASSTKKALKINSTDKDSSVDEDSTSWNKQAISKIG